MKKDFIQYIMIALMITGAYLIGVYKTKVEYLEKGTSTPTTAQEQAAAQQETTTPTTIDLAKVKEDLFDGKHITFGDKNAKLSFVEISDTSCPYCHIAGGKNPELNNQVGAQFKMKADGGSYVPAVPEMKKLVDEGKASFAWVYTPGHGNGEMGTQALYCAYEAGKFWEVHDVLMTSAGYDLLNEVVANDAAKSQELADFTKEAMDVTAMKSCLDSGKYKDRITEDPSWVQALGFGATPTFFINDQVVEGAASWDQGFSQVVEPLL